MSNYKRNKQGKLTQTYVGEPKKRVNVSLTPTAISGLDQMVSNGFGDSRSDVIEKIGRGDLPITHKEDNAVTDITFDSDLTTFSPITQKVKELLKEAQTIKNGKQKGATSKSWEKIEEAINLLAF